MTKPTFPPLPKKQAPEVRTILKAKVQALVAKDPLLTFRPSPIQDLYLRSDSPFRVIIGGNRAGKTTTNCVDLAYIARGLHPHRKIARRLRILVMTNTRQQAANVFGRKLFVASELPGKLHDTPLIPAAEVQVNYLKVGVHVPYLAVTKYADILFSWSAADNVWERLQGQKLDLCYFDEDAGSAKLVDEIFMRGMDARSSGEAPWLGGINWSATPTTATDGYLKFRTYCQENNAAKSYFYIPPGDNPSISQAAITEARSFLGDRQSQVRVDGTKDATELILIYGEQWKPERHIATEPHVLKPTDNLWLGYDPGMDHPTGMVLSATTPEDPITLRIVRCWWHARQTLDYDVRVLDEFLCGRRLAGIVYDYAASASLKMGNSVISELQASLARKNIAPLFGVYKAKKHREPGIAMVRHYLDPDPYNVYAPPLIKLDPPTPNNGLGILQRQFLSYRGKEATRFTGEGGVVKKDDDLMDALRYMCMHRIAYNPQAACGPATKAIVLPDTAPVLLPQAEVPKTQQTYERHLRMSRGRPSARGSRPWTEADF